MKLKLSIFLFSGLEQVTIRKINVGIKFTKYIQLNIHNIQECLIPQLELELKGSEKGS